MIVHPQRVREAESRMVMQFIKWAAEGALKGGQEAEQGSLRNGQESFASDAK